MRTSVLAADQAHAYQQVGRLLVLVRSPPEGAVASTTTTLLGLVWQATACLDGMFSQCYVLVDYAEWLLAHRFPASQARDALHAAADALLRVRCSSDADEGGGGGGGGGSVVSSVIRKSSGAISGVPASRQQLPGSSAASMRPTSTRQTALGASRMSGGASTPHGGTSRVAASTVGTAIVASQKSDWPDALEASHIDMLVRSGRLLVTSAR